MATELSAMAVIRATRPAFRSDHDKAAFAVHAFFMAAGYSLTAAGRSALAEFPPQGEDEVGIDGWNEFDDCYGFVYSKGTRRVLVKCLPVGDILAVDAMILGSDQREPFNLQINVREFVSNDGVGGSYDRVYRNLGRLVEIFNEGILKELEPTSKVSTSSERREAPSQSSSPPRARPSLAEPEPYSPLVFPPVPTPGFDDLHPGPGAGFFPLRGRPGDGSMLVGPHDPRFGQLDRPELGYPGGLAGIPPGARYDPIGPPDVPGFEPGRFIRPPRRPGGGTHPDLEHFQGPDYF